MNDLKIILTAFLITLLFSSCSNKKHPTFEDKLTLIPTEERIIFELDSVTKRSNQVVYFSNALNSYCIYNALVHAFYFYDIDSKENWQTVPLSHEGPNGIGQVLAFYVQSADSIYALSRTNYNLYLIDSLGKVTKKYNMLDLDHQDPVTVTQPQLFRSQSGFYTLVRPTQGASEAKNSKALYYYDLLKDSANYSMDYPTNALDGDWGRMLAGSWGTFNEEENTFVLSYPWDASVHVLDLASGQESVYYAGSELVKAPDKYIKGEDAYSYLKSICWYGPISYDPFRKVYYRSGFIGTDLSVDSGQKPRSVNGDDIFMVTTILDKDFNKVGEIAGLGVSFATIINQKGIYRFDTDFEPENEDIIAFRKYDLMEKSSSK